MIDYTIDKARKILYTSRQCRVYAVVVDKNGKILAEGANHYTKTHPKQAYHARMVGLPDKITLHAEISALVRIRKGNPHTIYIARVDYQGKPCLAKPCPICEHAIEQQGIKKVIHT